MERDHVIYEMKMDIFFFFFLFCCRYERAKERNVVNFICDVFRFISQCVDGYPDFDNNENKNLDFENNVTALTTGSFTNKLGHFVEKYCVSLCFKMIKLLRIFFRVMVKARSGL